MKKHIYLSNIIFQYLIQIFGFQNNRTGSCEISYSNMNFSRQKQSKKDKNFIRAKIIRKVLIFVRPLFICPHEHGDYSFGKK